MRYERAFCGKCRMSRTMLKGSRFSANVWIFYMICKHSGTKTGKILWRSDAHMPHKESFRKHLQPDNARCSPPGIDLNQFEC
ncbi:hypothetical protein JCM10003_1484 [Bacteroides pyogenes JCM 10003]|nr:hypothetical protein [Bacteroides pyogenes]GAE21961.1 hypothetical protein JCM10003_1484 [Bacteroides pyogenes JCM 10003]SUV33268.1 Uncharacterised protein [Bacteroides pyogenes]